MTSLARCLTLIALLAGLGHTAHAQPIDIPLGDNDSTTSILEVEVRRGRYPARNDQGEVVRELQHLLARIGYPTTADGDFGPGTERSLKAFQRDHNLSPDGVVGPNTLDALLAALAPTRPTPTPPPASNPQPNTPPSTTDDRAPSIGFTGILGDGSHGSLRRGDQGDDVRELQRLLDHLGYPTTADGDFGPGTERSLKAFQRDRGIDDDGVLGPNTRRHLRDAATPDTPQPPVTPEPTPQPPAAPRVTRRLSMGNLIVPEGYTPDANDLSLLIHFHGADDVIERERTTANLDTALLVINIQGFSSAYRLPFVDAGRFPRLLAEATTALADARDLSNPQLQTLTLSSFSAGYGAIRQILFHRRSLDALRNIVLSDSLHASYTNRRPRDSQMTDFYAFAERAASNPNLRLVISHSSIVPGSYASTTETATAILQRVGASRTPVRETGRRNMQRTSRTQRGGVLVLGYAGNAAADHVDQLQTIGDLFAALR